MGTKHTPGPWVWSGEPGGSDLFGLAGVKVIADYGYEGMSFSTLDDDQDIANARLIASAPELLKSLTDLVAIISDAWPALVHTGPMLDAQAAIAKATGDQP